MLLGLKKKESRHIDVSIKTEREKGSENKKIKEYCKKSYPDH